MGTQIHLRSISSHTSILIIRSKEVKFFRHDIFVDLQYDKFVNQSKSEEGQKLWQDIKVALRKQIEEKPISLSGQLKTPFVSVVCHTRSLLVHTSQKSFMFSFFNSGYIMF